jgi:CRP-like cAMP-binding protein
MVTPNQDLAIALALHGAVMRVPKDAVILQAGEQADGIYIVRSGKVDVQLLTELLASIETHLNHNFCLLCRFHPLPFRYRLSGSLQEDGSRINLYLLSSAVGNNRPQYFYCELGYS